MRWGAAGIGLAVVLLVLLAWHGAPDPALLEPGHPPPAAPSPVASPPAAAPPNTEVEPVPDAAVPTDRWPYLLLDAPPFGSDPAVEPAAELPPAQPVRISVVDPRGDLLPHARLFVETAEERRSAGRYGEAQRLELPTGVLETEWYGLPEPVTVRAVHPYVDGEVEAAVSRIEEARDLRLVLAGEPRGALEVRLAPSDVEPPPAVTLSLAPAGEGRPRLEHLSAGDTWLAGAMVPGTWRLVGIGLSRNWRVLPQDVEIVAGRTTRLALQAFAAPAFAGTVRDHAGELMPGVQVRVRQSLGLPGEDPGAFPHCGASWCPSKAVGAGTSVGGPYRAGLRGGEYRADVIVAEDAAFVFPGVSGAPFEVEVVAAVAPDGRIYCGERDPAIPRGTRTRSAVVVHRAVVPGQEPAELRAPARAASVELTLAGEFADARGMTVWVDGAMYDRDFVEKEGRRLRLAAMDLGAHSVLVCVHRGYHVTSAYAVTEVDCRPGVTTCQTLGPKIGAALVLDAVRGPGVTEFMGLYLWYFWRGRPLMRQQIYADRRPHNDAPADLDLLIRLDEFSAGELLPAEWRMRLTSGGTHDLGRVVARARPAIDPRWWLLPRQR